MFNIEVTQNNNFEKTYFKGPQLFRPVLFNPTRTQLNEFYGSDKEGELSYIKEGEDGIKSVMCTLYGYFTDNTGKEYKGIMPTIFVKEMFYESVKEIDGQTVKKYQFIDSFSNTTWATSKESIDSPYFYKAQSRACYAGEDKLMNFFMKLAGLSTYYSVDSKYEPNLNIREGKTFLSMEDLFKGDFTKYQQVITNLCTEKTTLKETNPLYMRTIGLVGSVIDDGLNCKQTYFTDAFISIKKDKGISVMNEYDVNRCLKMISPTDEKGNPKQYVWGHSGGVLSPKLEIYTPISGGSTNQAETVKEDYAPIPVESNTSIEENPFAL
jgi:hypothetical protein